jgi:hypothetical protein
MAAAGIRGEIIIILRRGEYVEIRRRQGIDFRHRLKITKGGEKQARYLRETEIEVSNRTKSTATQRGIQSRVRERAILNSTVVGDIETITRSIAGNRLLTGLCGMWPGRSEVP